MTTLVSPRHAGTFSALKHPNFRLYFFGQLISGSGLTMQAVAQGWLVFQLTHSELALGLVAAAAGIPSLVLSPFAGVVVDRFPRRGLIIFTQATQMILAFILAALVFTNTVEVWHIVVLAFLLGLSNTLDAPARQAFIRDMVGTTDMSSGITLNSMMMNGARIAGPGVAGVLLVSIGAGWCFFLNGVTFLAVLISLIVMVVPRQIAGAGRGSPLSQMREGLSFSLHHENIWPLLLLSAVTSLFVVNMITLLPAFADLVLHSPVEGLSAMSIAQGTGAISAGLLLGTLVSRFGRGRVAGFMVMVTSLSMVMISRTDQLSLSVGLMALVGFGMVSFWVNTNTMIQNEVPDAFRGRVMSLFTLTFLGLTPLGALALGWLAELVGTPNALAFYGLINGALAMYILTRWPGVWRIA